MYIYTTMYTWIYRRIYTYIFIYIYMHVCVCVCACVCACVRAGVRVHTHTHTHKCANARAPSLPHVQAFFISYISCVEVGVSIVKSAEQEHALMRRKETKQPSLQCRSFMCTSLCSPSHGRGNREKYLAEGHESGWQPFGRRRKRHSRCASGTLTICVNFPAPISTFSIWETHSWTIALSHLSEPWRF